MAYEPTYASLENIETYTQIGIDEYSVPTESEIRNLIKKFEKRVEERGLGSHAVTDRYLDVPTTGGDINEWSWEYDVEESELRFGVSEGIIIPIGNIKFPIVSVTSLYKNDEDLDSTPSWEELIEWDGSTGDTDFILLSSGKKDLGYALYVYDDEPEQGPKKLKMTYNWGYNINSEILGDWADLKTSIRILIARQGSDTTDNIGVVEGFDLGTHVATNYSDRIEDLQSQIDEIEEMYFPSMEETKDLGVVVF